MFTGIVEELGEVIGKEDLPDAARFVIRGPVVTGDAGHGDSIAVNGVCLTVAGSGWFCLTVLLSTMFRDFWRPMLIAGSLALVIALVEYATGIGPFHVMNATSYFRSGQLPWAALLAMALVASALAYAADRTYERQDI